MYVQYLRSITPLLSCNIRKHIIADDLAIIQTLRQNINLYPILLSHRSQPAGRPFLRPLHNLLKPQQLHL
jgi:hypothetical protein